MVRAILAARSRIISRSPVKVKVREKRFVSVPRSEPAVEAAGYIGRPNEVGLSQRHQFRFTVLSGNIV